MAVKVATSEMLLDSLMENPNVKAAVIVDPRGYIIDKRGAAAALKLIGSNEDTLPTSKSMPKKGPSENLYLVQAGEDFLVVVFDDRLNFERIKNFVDQTLAEFDMAPDLED